MTKTYKLNLENEEILIEVNTEIGHGSIESTLSDIEVMDEDDKAYKAAMNMLESVILAHACAGINVESGDYFGGLVVALEAFTNNR